MTASALSSAKDIAGMVQTGKEIDGTPGGFNNAIHSAKLKAIQDANSEMTTGKFGKDGDYRQVAIDNSEIAAKAITATNKRRTQLKKGGTDSHGNPIEKWSADKIAEGQAISSVQDEIKTQGVYNALQKEKSTKKNKKDGDGKNSDADAFRYAAMGAEFTGRKQENDMLGIGKKWAKETKSGKDVQLMADEQKIAAVSAIGGIKAGIAELKEHKKKGKDIVDSAIEDMVTNAQDQGKKGAAHAKILRKDFGKDLEGSHKGKTLSGSYNSLEKASTDSLVGKAEGIDSNIADGIDYTKNARSSERAQQHSMIGKIKGAGSEDAMVALAEKSARLSTSAEKGATTGQINPNNSITFPILPNS